MMRIKINKLINKNYLKLLFNISNNRLTIHTLKSSSHQFRMNRMSSYHLARNSDQCPNFCG